MSRIKLTRMVVATLIAAMLGGAYLIVAKNDTARRATQQETPAGFFH
jgi:hypothetical protein